MKPTLRTQVPEKLLKIAHDIGADGHVNQTRLTVLKKWFERPQRLRAFAIWMAQLAISHNDRNTGKVGELFQAARALLADVDAFRPELDREAAQGLYYRLRAFQSEYRSVPWGGALREIHDWNLLLVEEGLRIYLGAGATPSDGYKLAADYCQNYDPRHGANLNGPSRDRVEEIARFLFEVEALESVE